MSEYKVPEFKKKEKKEIDKEDVFIRSLHYKTRKITDDIVKNLLKALKDKHDVEPFDPNRHAFGEDYEEYLELAKESKNNPEDKELKNKVKYLKSKFTLAHNDQIVIIADYFFKVFKELEEVGIEIEFRTKKNSNNILIYNNKFWSTYSEEEFDDILRKFYVRLNLDIKFFFGRAKTKKDFQVQVKSVLGLKSFEFTKHAVSLVNFLNGTFELGTTEARSQFREHRKEDGLEWILPMEYDVNAKCPKWDAHLEKVLFNRYDCIKTVNEFFGLLLFHPETGKFKPEKCLVLLGDGRNGKSVVINVVKAVIGPDNVAENRLEDFVKNEAAQVIAEVENKRAILSAENNPGPSDFDKIRGIISQEGQRARRLFKDAYFTDKIPLMVLAVNKLINFSQLDANWERLIPIKFEYSFIENEKEKKVGFHREIIATDLPGITNLWFRSFWDLYERQKFVLSNRTKELIGEWKAETDTFVRWVENEGLEPVESGKKVSVQRLHHLYCTYSELVLKRPQKFALGDVQFGKRLRKAGFAPTTLNKKTAYFVNTEPKDYEQLKLSNKLHKDEEERD